MQEAGLPEPENSIKGMFTVSLKCPLKPSEKTVEEAVEEIILNLILENPKVTAIEMAKVTGLSRRGVEYHLGKLKQKGKISRIGSTKAGNWIIQKPKGK
jgi:ATP-dependent DNA helicase RecG